VCKRTRFEVELLREEAFELRLELVLALRTLDERLRGDLSTVAVVVGGCLFRSCIFVLIILFAGSLTGF